MNQIKEYDQLKLLLKNNNVVNKLVLSNHKKSHDYTPFIIDIVDEKIYFFMVYKTISNEVLEKINDLIYYDNVLGNQNMYFDLSTLNVMYIEDFILYFSLNNDSVLVNINQNIKNKINTLYFQQLIQYILKRHHKEIYYGYFKTYSLFINEPLNTLFQKNNLNHKIPEYTQTPIVCNNLVEQTKDIIKKYLNIF